jgi:hypothetical protein
MRLASAPTGNARGRASRALAADFDAAARAVDRLGGSANQQLATALAATARRYRRAATAAAGGDSRAFHRVRARAEEAAASLISTQPAASDSGVGDSRSDDPSDDEPDEEEP